MDSIWNGRSRVIIITYVTIYGNTFFPYNAISVAYNSPIMHNLTVSSNVSGVKSLIIIMSCCVLRKGLYIKI